MLLYRSLQLCSLETVMKKDLSSHKLIINSLSRSFQTVIICSSSVLFVWGEKREIGASSESFTTLRERRKTFPSVVWGERWTGMYEEGPRPGIRAVKEVVEDRRGSSKSSHVFVATIFRIKLWKSFLPLGSRNASCAVRAILYSLRKVPDKLVVRD